MSETTSDTIASSDTIEEKKKKDEELRQAVSLYRRLAKLYVKGMANAGILIGIVSGTLGAVLVTSFAPEAFSGLSPLAVIASAAAAGVLGGVAGAAMGYLAAAMGQTLLGIVVAPPGGSPDPDP